MPAIRSSIAFLIFIGSLSSFPFFFRFSESVGSYVFLVISFRFLSAISFEELRMFIISRHFRAFFALSCSFLSLFKPCLSNSSENLKYVILSISLLELGSSFSVSVAMAM